VRLSLEEKKRFLLFRSRIFILYLGLKSENMKFCPNCNAELEDSFELCWSCNYSLTEKKVVEIADNSGKTRKIDCLRCKIPLAYSGNFKFQEGERAGFWGDFFELLVNREAFDIYICSRCGQVEFYTPRD